MPLKNATELHSKRNDVYGNNDCRNDVLHLWFRFMG